MMEELGKIYPEIDWTANADAEAGDLMAKVASGDLEFTVTDSTDFNILRNFYPDLYAVIRGIWAEVSKLICY